MTQDEIVKKAKEEFVRRFVEYHDDYLPYVVQYKEDRHKLPDDIISFLSQTLLSAMAQVRKETKEECIKAMGEEIPLPVKTGDWKSIDYDFHFAKEIGYNQHRSESIKRIEEMK